MIDQIIIPKKEVIKLRIPKEMIGKTMKLIVFEISDFDFVEIEETDQREREIEELTENSLVNLSRFVFDRIEANNYDE